MNRRTLLAGIGGASLAGTAGCYGLAQLITGDDNNENSNENAGDTEGNENATDSPLADVESSEGNATSEETADEESSENDENDEDESNGNQRPEDPVNTISVTDHGVDVSKSDDPDVDREIHCYGTFEIGEYDLRDVRIDAVALAENGDRLDHGWVPFATVGAGESYDVDIPFYVNPDEIAEYRIGATEATYAE